ncbi:DUF1493 family protein [Salmonella enterica]
MLTEKYDFRITDQMTIPLRPHWIANDSYREKCKMLVLNRSKGEIHKVDFSKVTLALMDDFFTTFNVDKGNFSITTYYPPEPPLKHLLNPFRKNDIPQVPEFTIGMLIASARSGRWLYD